MSASRRLLIVGIDGLRIDDALGGAAPAPALSALVGAGTIVPMTMEVPTISGPGWSSLLRGVPHAVHAVVDNRFVAHTLDRSADLLTRVGEQAPERTTFAAASWPPIVDPAGPGPILAPQPARQRRGLHRVVVRDGETYGYRGTDAEIAACARFALREDAPDAAFVYLGEVDEAGHLYGGTSPEYAAAIARVDAHLEAILAGVEARVARADEDWLVAVTTDHGHGDAGGHGGGSDLERRSFLALRRYGSVEPLPALARIDPWQVAPLLLSQIGLAAG